MTKTNDPSEDERQTIAQAIKIIEADLRAHHSIPSLASDIGVNEAKLKKLFHQSTGMGLFHYLKEIRLQKAKELLEERKKTVEQVAISVGYSNASALIHPFKKRFGISPGQYQSKGLPFDDLIAPK